MKKAKLKIDFTNKIKNPEKQKEISNKTYTFINMALGLRKIGCGNLKENAYMFFDYHL